MLQSKTKYSFLGTYFSVELRSVKAWLLSVSAAILVWQCSYSLPSALYAEQTKSLNISSYVKFSNPLIILAALHWTFNRFSVSLMSCGETKLDMLFLVWMNKC